MGRLARRLTGTSVGVVLGGGGAKGLAHIGIIRAMEEAGMSILHIYSLIFCIYIFRD